MEEKEKELEKKIEDNKIELMEKIEEKEKQNQEKERQNKELFKKLMEEMKGMKEIEKYMREKIIIEQKEEREIKNYLIQRKKTINKDIFNMDIAILLFNEKIKFKIKEIQDDLKSNPILYESDFVMDSFGKLSDYYKNEGGIKAIFEFLVPILKDGRKDNITKEENKIIIRVKYTFGNKEDEITFYINKKEVGLKNILANIDKSLKEMNKDFIGTKEEVKETKEEFKKNLLEKVYPIGSYYWSEKDISPDNIFGGRWTKIQGKFLFASDSNHWVGKTGGEETHNLTVDEMPNHSHQYKEITYSNKYYKQSGRKEVSTACPSNNYDHEEFYRYSQTGSCGGNKSHNNMPPYLTANCWKRIG